MNSRILGLASLLLVGCAGPVHMTPQPEMSRHYVVCAPVASMSAGENNDYTPKGVVSFT